MPNYAPQDMAYLLRISKPSGKMTQEEMALAQNIGQAVAPMGAKPVDMRQLVGSSMTAGEMQRMANPAPMADPQQAMKQIAGASMTAQEMQAMQPQPMNRLAAIQAAANQVLAGGENPEGQRMANIAKYFQGRQ